MIKIEVKKYNYKLCKYLKTKSNKINGDYCLCSYSKRKNPRYTVTFSPSDPSLYETNTCIIFKPKSNINKVLYKIIKS